MCTRYFVEAWSDIAYNKSAVQSDTVDDADVQLPVDGIVSTSPYNCIRIRPTKDPWWSVDLGQMYRIKAVVITTTADQLGGM